MSGMMNMPLSSMILSACEVVGPFAPSHKILHSTRLDSPKLSDFQLPRVPKYPGDGKALPARSAYRRLRGIPAKVSAARIPNLQLSVCRTPCRCTTRHEYPLYR